MWSRRFVSRTDTDVLNVFINRSLDGVDKEKCWHSRNLSCDERMDDDVLHNSLRSLEKQQRSSMRRSVTSMSPIRVALAIDWKRDGLFFSFRKRFGNSPPHCTESQSYSREISGEKNVEQHCSIPDESSRRVDLSYSRSFGSLGYSDFGSKCVHTLGENHWDIWSLPGKVLNQTRRRHSTIPIRYLCWRDITCTEWRFFLDNQHVGSQWRRNRWREGETIRSDIEEQSSNTRTCFVWFSHFRSQCSSVRSNTADAEKQNESERDSISCRDIEDQQSNCSILFLI